MSKVEHIRNDFCDKFVDTFVCGSVRNGPSDIYYITSNIGETNTHLSKDFFVGIKSKSGKETIPFLDFSIIESLPQNGYSEVFTENFGRLKSLAYYSRTADRQWKRGVCSKTLMCSSFLEEELRNIYSNLKTCNCYTFSPRVLNSSTLKDDFFMFDYYSFDSLKQLFFPKQKSLEEAVNEMRTNRDVIGSKINRSFAVSMSFNKPEINLLYKETKIASIRDNLVTPVTKFLTQELEDFLKTYGSRKFLMDLK